MYFGISFNIIFYFFLSLSLTFITFKLSPFFFKNFSSIPEGPQHIHDHQVYRCGGLIIFIMLLVLSGNEQVVNSNTKLNYYFIFTLIPVFLIGFWEDIRQTISPQFRLLASFCSAALFVQICSNLF